MPERIQKLRATIDELEAELADLKEVDDDTRAALRAALLEIHQALSRSDHDYLASDTLTGRLQASAEAFDASHPTVMGLIRRMIDALGQMGI